MVGTSTLLEGSTALKTLKKLIWDIAFLGPLEFMSKKLKAKEPWFSMKKHIWHFGVFGPSDYLSKIFPTTRMGRALRGRKRNSGTNKKAQNGADLRPGDWVEVRPFEEIFATLNAEGMHRGLVFTKEMMQYCGRKFKVLKKLEKIVLESTGEMRIMKTPTVILDNCFCHGEAHGNCDRTCFCFWREVWLRRIPSPENEEP
jgi:hypothetical protein